MRERLGLKDAAAFLDEMETQDAEDVRLPEPSVAASQLAQMRVPDADIAEALAARPEQQELLWLLTRCRARLTNHLGEFDWPTPWPALPDAYGAVGRYFYLWVVLAALPDVRRYHAERGIPDDISWATLADVGEKVARHRAVHGIGGLHAPDWFSAHFRGVLYALGRLQFNLGSVDDSVPHLERGTTVLGTHIPEAPGPLSPVACDESFERAALFFEDHFGIACTVTTCDSWLLDHALAQYLPEDSNIVRFQRRYHLSPKWHEGNADVIQFVFKRKNTHIDELPQRTTLERAIVSHIRAGLSWKIRSGYLELR